MFDIFAQKGLIKAQELQSALSHSNAGICILDASFALPDAGINPWQNFLESRIPNARYFDISKICDLNSPLPHMLPSTDIFEDALSELGVANDDFVVIYGQDNMAMGPARAWWMFHVFGHNKVAVLDGGLKAWAANGGFIESGMPAVLSSDRIKYTKVQFNAALICDLTKVLNTTKDKQALCPVLDARPIARFSGSQPEPRSGLRSGHIPNSINIPASSLLNSVTGELKPVSELNQIFDLVLNNSPEKIILTCGSGVTACMLALGLYNLGYKNFSVYDGSWAEWGQHSLNMPYETK